MVNKASDCLFIVAVSHEKSGFDHMGYKLMQETCEESENIFLNGIRGIDHPLLCWLPVEGSSNRWTFDEIDLIQMADMAIVPRRRRNHPRDKAQSQQHASLSIGS